MGVSPILDVGRGALQRPERTQQFLVRGRRSERLCNVDGGHHVISCDEMYTSEDHSSNVLLPVRRHEHVHFGSDAGQLRQRIPHSFRFHPDSVVVIFAGNVLVRFLRALSVLIVQLVEEHFAGEFDALGVVYRNL